MGLATVAVFLKRDANVATNLLSELRGTGFSGATNGAPFSLNLQTLVWDKVGKSNVAAVGEGYWQYDGSLTTPGCNENVLWLVGKRELAITAGRKILYKSTRIKFPHQNFLR